MSAGSFCRSPSIGTITLPRAWSMPAIIAPVWPTLRLKEMTRNRGLAAAAAINAASVPSLEPSSMKMTSYGRAIGVSAAVNACASGATLSASLNMGMMTETRSGDTA
jgi:hypothetical protein